MLRFEEVVEDRLIEGRNSDRNLRCMIHKHHDQKIGFISIESTPDELRQIADKLDELNKAG